MIKNYYKILDVSFNASKEDIKKAFRKLAVFWHPDRNSNPIAIKKMQELNEAYEILSNPVKKETYDKIYKELYLINTEITISQKTSNQKSTEEKFKEKEKEVSQKFNQEIEQLNNWIKNIKFSLSSFDKFLNMTIAKADKPIENFMYYLPYVLAVIFIILIIIAIVT